MLRIALFGTSADPPTAGHQAIVRWLSQHYDWVAVWASDNPLKSHQTPLEHRAAMLGLLINDLPQNNIGLYQELSSPRTLETVERSRRRWAEAELTLVVGSDLVRQLSRWYQVENLLRQVQLLVVPRPGFIIDDRAVEEVRQLGTEVAIANLDAPAVSSTAYRENKDPHALTSTVEAYIHQKNLY